MNAEFSDLTPDICDAHPQVQIAESGFIHYGSKQVFYGMIQTVRCYRDNSRVKEVLASPGAGQVLVVDGGEALDCSLMGDNVAADAIKNGWAGVLINGCIRDVQTIASMPLGVLALGTYPRKTEKLGQGDVGVVLKFAGVRFVVGHWLYADCNGVVVSAEEIDLATLKGV